MGRAPCCSKVGLHRGPWSNKVDALLTKYIQTHGEGQWRSLPKRAGLLRCGKSCRLRWMNYLRPDIKRGSITLDEEDLIVRLHSLLGNRWSLIAGRLPGRTDNEIKNYWNTHLSKRLKHQETEPDIHKTKHRPAPEPKKRKTNNKNSSNKKQKKNNKNRVNGETAKTKIHIPKPTRVFTSLSLPISRNNSFENNAVSRSSSRGSDKGDDTEDVVDLLVSDLKVGDDSWGVLVRDEGHDLVNDCDLSFQSQVPTKDHMLEKLYEEYLQLLQTDEEEDQV